VHLQGLRKSQTGRSPARLRDRGCGVRWRPLRRDHLQRTAVHLGQGQVRQARARRQRRPAQAEAGGGVGRV
jgi:hypothetical protein